MAAAVSGRAMAQQPIHSFFAGQPHVSVVVPLRKAEEPAEVAPGAEEKEGSFSRTDANADIDEDPNQERRKRRRTVSPELYNTTVSDESTTGPDALSVQAESEAARNSHPLSSRDKILPTAEQEKESLQGQVDGASDHPKPKSQARTPSKSRTLRLRPDGTLRSPSFADTTEEPRGRRKRKSGGKKNRSLAIKYGRTPHERLTLGRKIDQILSGKIRVGPNVLPTKGEHNEQKEKLNGDREQKDQAPLQKESGRGTPKTSKETHPFFMGKTKRDLPQSSGSGSRLSSEGESHQPTNRSKLTVAGFPSSFGASFAKPVKVPGAIEALLPPAGMQHVRGLAFDVEAFVKPPQSAEGSTRKLKGREHFILPGEEVYQPQKKLVSRIQNEPKQHDEDDYFASHADVKARKLLLMTGRELQKRTRELLAAYEQQSASIAQKSMSVPENQNKPKCVSEASEYLLDKIATSFAAFDTFDYDTQDWCHKYAPKKAAHILQDQRDTLLIRDWLHSMSVNHVGTKFTNNDGKLDARKQLAAKRRKRKVKDELDDFIVSSDEEENSGAPDETQEVETVEAAGTLPSAGTVTFALKKLKTGNISKTRAVLLSGPHGCGKSASVHAIATELDFEVFEINPGTRRNGRDIMEKVGDMTRNHLVRHGSLLPETDASDVEEVPPLISEAVDEKQKSMTSFFTNNKEVGTARKDAHTAPKAATLAAKQNGRPPQKQQKQSLILLEEVDVLFEEDKPFWSAVFSLIVQSRRPIVMTCTDEQCLPLEEFIDTSVVRFTSPSPAVVTEYLTYLAANEGHLLPPAAVNDLVALRGNDLRGALTELQFWCQMAVGDNKQGITWFTEAQKANKKRARSEDKLRIVSETTYYTGCFPFETKQGRPRDLGYGSRLLAEAYEFNGFDPLEFGEWSVSSRQNHEREDRFRNLRLADICYDTLSASDTWLTSPKSSDVLDPSQPNLSTSGRSNYVDNYKLLQTDPFEQLSGLGHALAFSIRAACTRNLPMEIAAEERVKRKELVSMCLTRQRQNKPSTSQMRCQTRQAFDSLSEPQEGTPWNPSKGPGISVFNGPFGTVAAEIAPVVRSIALHDLDLEEERRKLNDLLDVPGRKGKRQRTTRASRAALEGGSKASTRRERWWSNEIDYKPILRTAGSGWTRAALRLSFDAQKIGTNGDAHPASTPPSTGQSTADQSADEIA